MVNELVAQGKDRAYLESLPRDKVKAIYEQGVVVKAVPVTPVAVVKPAPKPVAKPVARLSQDVTGPIYQACMTGMANLKAHYDLDNECEIPERITDYALKIYFAHTLGEAEETAKRASDKLFIHLMWLVSEGKISGDANQRYSEKQAVKAENLAKWLESKGQADNAAKQRARAADIRAKMAEFKAKVEAA
jgi:hypothetical protein